MERSSEKIQEYLDDLVRRCRNAGMNVTPQRIAVYRALLESTAHPTPESLFRSIRETMPSLSLATIYKALEALEGLELVREVPVVSESRRLDANMEPHHHLVCTSCGSVADHYDETLNRLLPETKLGGFEPHRVSVQFEGICSICTSMPH